MTRKIFLCVTGPYECGAWAELWTEEETRDFVKGCVSLKAAPSLDHPFKALRVEKCHGSEDTDGKVYVWDKQPGCDSIDTDHIGTRVILDDEVVYNDFKPADPAEHDPDCEDCAKIKSVRV